MHKKLRKITANLFHFQELEKKIPLMVNCAQDLINKIQTHNKINQKDKIHFEPHFKRYTGDVVSASFFGEEFNKNTLISGKPIAGKEKKYIIIIIKYINLIFYTKKSYTNL